MTKIPEKDIGTSRKQNEANVYKVQFAYFNKIKWQKQRVTLLSCNYLFIFLYNYLLK